MALVTLLQSKRYVTSDQLEDRFDISIRTVYRDMRALSEIGVPVGFEPGKGYFVVQGYFLPPVVFTQEEANAMILMESISGKFGDKSVQKSYVTAMEKVRATLKGDRKEQVERLRDQIRVYIPPDDNNDGEYLGMIQSAIIDQVSLIMEYSNVEGKKSIREVEPIGLTFYGMDWHMIAWCWNRKAYRDFKAGRIGSLRSTGTSFKKTGHIDVNEYIRQLK